jgi:ligand-binding sensor domain-containing protein
MSVTGFLFYTLSVSPHRGIPSTKQLKHLCSKQEQNKIKMRNLITLAKKLLKPVAVVKYLFFPFIMAQSQDVVDFNKITQGQKIVAQVETETTLWAGTTNGIYRINKATGKAIHLTTSNSPLLSNTITAMCTTPNGNVYATTPNGIFRFDGSAYLLISTENAKLPTNNFTGIASDERGRLFIGTQNNGIVMLDGYRCQLYDRNNSDLTCNGVTKIYMDENGLIIAQLNNGNYAAMGNSTMVLINNQQTDLNATAGN